MGQSCLTLLNAVTANSASYSFWQFITIYADTTTNFVCVTLNYKLFAHWYERVCCCVDARCNRMWTRMINKNVELSRIVSASATSGQNLHTDASSRSVDVLSVSPSAPTHKSTASENVSITGMS